jgi:hypothetical protein
MININKEEWGPKVWHLLHSFSINNNFRIPDNKIHNYYIFYTSFLYILPCIICSEHYSDILYNLYPLEEDKITRIYLKKWVYDVHNIVNKILKKPKFSYKIFLENSINPINHEDIFFIIDAIYKNFDYENMSLYKYDQIFNFFINFCTLYPDKNIKKQLKKIINKKDFIKVKTPNEFHLWYIRHSLLEEMYPK